MILDRLPRIERLKKRAEHCCCRYCGGELHVRQIIFHTQAEARIELYCDQCAKIEYGVEKAIFEGAKAFVNSTEFNYFPSLDDSEQRLQMNIAKVCSLTNWQLRFLGLVDDEGFKVPIEKNLFDDDQCTTFDQSNLLDLLKEASLWHEQLSPHKE